MIPKPIFETKRSSVFNQDNIPPKYKKELDDILENIEAIHGKKFVEHVKFLLNIRSFVDVIMVNTTLDKGTSPQKFTEMMNYMIIQLIASHADACGIKLDEHEPAIKAAETMGNIVKALQKESDESRGA